MLLLLLIALLVFLILGGVSFPTYGYYGWSPVGALLIIIVILLLFHVI